MKIAVEDNRADILSLLRVNSMTVSELSEVLDKTPSTVYRHLKKLEEAGYVEVNGAEKDNHLPKKLYSRTADIFLLSPATIEGKDASALKMKWEKSNAEEVLKFLEIMGYSSGEGTGEEELVEELAGFFVDLRESIINPIAKVEGQIEDMSIPLLFRLELLMFLLEIKKDEETGKTADNLLSKIRRE